MGTFFHRIHLDAGILIALLLSLPIFGEIPGLPKIARNRTLSNMPIDGDFQDMTGFNIKFIATTSVDWDSITNLGVKWVRATIQWPEYDKGNGQYSWSGYDSKAQDIASRGLSAILIVTDFNNHYPNYPELGNCWDSTAITAYGNFLDTLARRNKKIFPNFRVIYEVWNEPDGEDCAIMGVHNVGAQYTLLVKEASRRLNAIDWVPGMRPALIGPTISEIGQHGRTFLSHCINNGILEHIDGLSVHPYRSGPTQSTPALKPENAWADYDTLKLYMGSWANVIPIVSSEVGYAWSSLFGDNDSVPSSYFVETQERQAEYLARLWAYHALQKIPLSIWYTFSDDLSSNDAPTWDRLCGVVESGFGDHPSTNDILKKTSYKSASSILETLKGSVYQERLNMGDVDEFVLRFRNVEQDFDNIVFWSIKDTIDFVDTLPTYTSGSYTQKSMLGIETTIHSNPYGLPVTFGKSPKYILGLPTGASINPSTPNKIVTSIILPLLSSDHINLPIGKPIYLP